MLELGAQQLELGGQRAHPHAEHQSPAADPVEGAVALGDLQRVVIPEHQHCGDQPKASGVRGEETQRGQRIPIRDAPPVRLLHRDSDVFGAGQMVEAVLVGRAGNAREFVGAGALFPRGGHPGQLHDHGCGQSDPHRVVVAVRVDVWRLRPGDRDRYRT